MCLCLFFHKCLSIYHVHVQECECDCEMTLRAGTWQSRDESANLLQKHDVELIKDAKRQVLPSTHTHMMAHNNT